MKINTRFLKFKALELCGVVLISCSFAQETTSAPSKPDTTITLSQEIFTNDVKFNDFLKSIKQKDLAEVVNRLFRSQPVKNMSEIKRSRFINNILSFLTNYTNNIPEKEREAFIKDFSQKNHFFIIIGVNYQTLALPMNIHNLIMEAPTSDFIIEPPVVINENLPLVKKESEEEKKEVSNQEKSADLIKVNRAIEAAIEADIDLPGISQKAGK